MILLIDNYDSFVFNLARYFERLGQETRVVRNSAIDVDGIRQLGADAVILSPGPCTPNEAGCSLDIVRQLQAELPILGICLGHQTIAAAFGGLVVRAVEPVHGRPWKVEHQNQGLFAGLPNPFMAARYHSLVVDEPSLPEELEVTARTPEGVVMGIAHRQYPVVGWQFHPESVLTESGYDLLAAFLRSAGLPVAAEIPDWSTERTVVHPYVAPPFSKPVTF